MRWILQIDASRERQKMPEIHQGIVKATCALVFQYSEEIELVDNSVGGLGIIGFLQKETGAGIPAPAAYLR
jgi:hypothetical protein